MRNVTKDRLAEGKIAFGLKVSSSRTIEIVRMAATSGYHYLFIDLEHTTMGIETAAELCAASLGEGVTSIVRVPGSSPEVGARLLDSGAQGLMLPHIHTAEQARAAVREYRVPPFGNRAEGGGALLGWDQSSRDERFRRVNDNTMIVVMVESVEAINNIDEIAAVEGVDAIDVGTFDLSIDLGIPMDTEHPEIQAAYEKVVAAGNRHGKAVRLGGAYTTDFILRSMEMGARMLTVTGDTRLLIEGMRNDINELRRRASMDMDSR